MHTLTCFPSQIFWREQSKKHTMTSPFCEAASQWAMTYQQDMKALIVKQFGWLFSPLWPSIAYAACICILNFVTVVPDISKVPISIDMLYDSDWGEDTIHFVAFLPLNKSSTRMLIVPKIPSSICNGKPDDPVLTTRSPILLSGINAVWWSITYSSRLRWSQWDTREH